MEDTKDYIPKETKTLNYWEKYTLTIEEAVNYFGIGETRLRKLISEDRHADYVLMNGTKTLIKRKKFEQILDTNSSL